MSDTNSASPLAAEGRRTICVFCGSSKGVKPIYAQSAWQLGTLLGRHGFDLVFGGGGIGLMDVVSQAAREAGASVTSIVPDFLHKRVAQSAHTTEVVVTGSMHERKAKMFALADGFVSLPGGIGTLEETVEMLTWAQLELHAKPIVLLNAAGYWNELLACLQKMIVEDFAQPKLLDMLWVATTAEETVTLLSGRCGAPAT